jgi:hypothetical protein
MAVADQAYSVTVTAGGTATQRIQTGSKFETWTVSQVSVEMPAAPIGATCWLRKNGAPITPLIPTGDAATGDPPITLRPGETLTVEFAGCTVGDVGQIYVVYDDGTPA